MRSKTTVAGCGKACK
jgi:hypothetical protein